MYKYEHWKINCGKFNIANYKYLGGKILPEGSETVDMYVSFLKINIVNL